MDAKDLTAIHDRLDELEKLIKTVKGEGISYQISIEHAEFHSPIVEHLDYHFDKLDVKEVSGALNLGNNFGVRVGQAKKEDDRVEDGDETIAKKAGNHSDERPAKTDHTGKKENDNNTKIQEDQDRESARRHQPSPPLVKESKVSKPESTKTNNEQRADQKKHRQSGKGLDRENNPSTQKKRPSVSEKRSSVQPGSTHRSFNKKIDPNSSEAPPFKISFFSRGQSTKE